MEESIRRRVPPGFRLDIARAVQRRLSLGVRMENVDGVERVGGVDVAYIGDLAFSASVTLSMDGKPLDACCTVNRVIFPYVPTLLSFRELTPMVRSFLCLRVKPDILMVDGQGVMHPYRLGIASHIGVTLNLRTIGVAKSRLYGVERGDVVIDERDGQIIGRVVMCGKRKLYVSVGHRVDLDGAVGLVKSLCVERRGLPIPLAAAHDMANRAKRTCSGLPLDKWGSAACEGCRPKRL